MAVGFFLVLILEKIVLTCKERDGASEERAPLIADSRNEHGHGHGHDARVDLEGSGHHVHVDFQAHSSFRSFILFLSLSLHSVFEGLAIGLQSSDSKVRAATEAAPVKVSYHNLSHHSLHHRTCSDLFKSAAHTECSV